MTSIMPTITSAIRCGQRDAYFR